MGIAIAKLGGVWFYWGWGVVSNLLKFCPSKALSERAFRLPLKAPGIWKIGKVYMGALKLRLKATLCNARRIVYNCAHLWPFGPLFTGNFRCKMPTIVDNRGQLWTSTLSPRLLSPHLDFPDSFCANFFENPSGHGRPRPKSLTSAPKSGISCGPVMVRNFLTPGQPGVRIGNVRRKFGPKSLCLCCFSFPEKNRRKKRPKHEEHPPCPSFPWRVFISLVFFLAVKFLGLLVCHRVCVCVCVCVCVFFPHVFQ